MYILFVFLVYLEFKKIDDLYKKLFIKLKKNNLKKYEEINDVCNINICM